MEFFIISGLQMADSQAQWTELVVFLAENEAEVALKSGG